MADHPIRQKVQVHLFRRPSSAGEVRYLVLRRPDSRGGIWQPVTGNLDPGEDLDSGALREVAEETGISTLRSCKPLSQFDFQKDGRTFRETVYAAEVAEENVRLSGEHIDYRWVPYAEARKLIHFDSNREALDLVHRTLKSTSDQETSSR